MRTLDLSRPFGTIHGANDGRRYEQEGHFFDNEGNEVVPPSPEIVRTPFEMSQYQRDVEAAAKLLAARK